LTGYVAMNNSNILNQWLSLCSKWLLTHDSPQASYEITFDLFYSLFCFRVRKP